jgi:hypothetical protein
MNSQTFSVDSAVMRVDRQIIAVVRCAAESLDRTDLAAAIEDLPAEVTLVVLGHPNTPAEIVGALAGQEAPTATGHAVTDALKRVADGKLSSTVERSTIYRAGLPMVIEREQLEQHIENLDPGAVPPSALLSSYEWVTLVDESGTVAGAG